MDLQNPVDRHRLSRLLELLGKRLTAELLGAEFADLSREDLRALFDQLAAHMRRCSEWTDAASTKQDVPRMSGSLYCDGASRGNPGPSGAGVVILDKNGEQIFELSRFLDNATNNEAEYKALIRGLSAAADVGIKGVQIFLDSELVVNQLLGTYKVRNPRLLQLFEEAMSRLQLFDEYAIFHVGRELNQKADRLANEAIDRGLRGGDRETYRLKERE
jgi:ribonuclease HI